MEIPQDYQLISQQNLYKPEGNEWHDIFQVMKGKNFQPRTLFSARFSIRFDGRNQKLSRQAEVKRIQHH